MKLWKRFICATIVGVVLLIGIVGFFTWTFRREVSSVKSATSMTLADPEETLTAADLQKFLEGFESDNLGQIGLRYAISTRRGHIRIDGVTYPIEFVQDKFLGDVLLVHCRWKTLLIHRRWKTLEEQRQDRLAP
jgi:hypothetical protein